MQSLPIMRLHRLVWLVLFLASCATLAGSGDKQGTRPGRGEDEEAGVKRVTALMREFNRALEVKDFEGAGAKLREAEGGIGDASEVTRSHPEFEEIEARVARARPKLEQAIERDRIERRNAAINDLVRRGGQLMHQGNILLGELARRVPEGADMDDLGDTIGALAAIEREGTPFLDEPRYREHALQRDALATTLLGRRRQAEWQIQASGAIGKTIEAAFDAVAAAKQATSGPDQLVALRRATDAFARCASAIADAESLGGYVPSSVVTTRMGTLAVNETKRRCLDTGAKVRAQADRLAFHERVSAIVARVDAALATFREAPAAAEKLTAAEAAVEALAQCQTELEAAQRGSVHDASLTFTSALGPALDAGELRRACGGERARLAKSLPEWRWRKSFEGMRPGLVEIEQGIREAAGESDVGDQIELWQRVLGKLGDCVERSRALGKERDADGRHALVSALGSLTVSGVEKECERQRVVAEAKLARAVEAQSIESFAGTCEGDEVAVVRREGVPTQVVPVEGGRLFVYGKGPAAKRFGFDGDGDAVDFAVKWREQVEQLGQELGRATQAMKSAESGAALLTATEAALPVLEVCLETLTGTERHPGFDAKLRFATALGKLTAAELRAACQRRRGELSGGMQTLRWRVQLEAVRDRALEASMQLEGARSAAAPEARVTESGAALGSYRECLERAEAMARAPSADKKLTVNGPFGPVTVLGLAKACKAEIASAQAALDAALEAQKLERFLASCKGDEVEVVRREGMPDRIDSAGTGRIFTYQGKSKKARPRRIAFDASGSRVEESALKR